MTTPKPSPKAIFANSLVYQVIINPDEKTVFMPVILNAFIGNTILFTFVNFGSHISRIILDRFCQINNSLNAINFLKLIFFYLVITADPTWFICPLPQQDCEFSGKRKDFFSLNPPNSDAANTSYIANTK